MTISVSLNRPKATPVVEVPLTLAVGNPTTTGNAWAQYINLNGINPGSFVVTCATEDLSDSVVASVENHGIREGDAVSGTGIPALTEVLAVDGVNITLSEAATATGASVELTFDPPAVDARLIGIAGDLTVSGTNVRVRVRLYRATGSTVTGTVDETAIADMGAAIGEVTLTSNLDSFLSNVRIPRTNV